MIDLEALGARIFPPVGGLGFAETDADTTAMLTAGPALLPDVEPNVLGALARWIGHGAPEPDACALALVVDPASPAAQSIADHAAAAGEEVEIEGQPCYREGDDHGIRYLTLATPGVVLYLLGTDDERLGSVAAGIFGAWQV